MNSSNQKLHPIQTLALFVGPLLSLIIILFFDLEPGHPEVTRTAAVAFLMAVWWITEAVPLAVTALLPVALFPLLGVMKGKIVASFYFNNIIFLFIGGFILALAMQRWQLHKRIALKIILAIGVSPKRIILGFMGATAFLSMWISNTATTMIMVSIAMAIILKLEENFDPAMVSRFATGMLLSIAYAASIGGMATLIGTPPNLAFAKIFSISFPHAPEVSFARWMIFALPVSLVFLLCTWGLLSFLFARSTKFIGNSDVFKNEYQKLGKMGFEEWVVLLDFMCVCLLWLFRKDITIGALHIKGWSSLFPQPKFIDDGTVAIAFAIPLFFIPARKVKEMIMDWETASRLPWGIVLLFGGGFALAAGFKESGLSVWIGKQLTGLSRLHVLFIVAAICTIMTFLTELTSNTATTQTILPILASVSLAIKMNPFVLMIPATLSASCAFMLPVATPPNAIIFGTQRLRVYDMAKTGIILNILGIILITAAIFLWGKLALGINLAQFPLWVSSQ
ncbi:MAG: SLC13 family permease [Candidatus Desulfofervidaceae bacterium]|nr:SLC13 family permease [Candidatus Desulfofervidaceae bacterium]